MSDVSAPPQGQRKEITKLRLRPGIFTQASQTANEGGYSVSNLGRWKDGFFEKLAGWAQLFSTQLTGLARGMHAYQGLDGVKYLSMGADGSFQMWDGTNLRSFPMPGEQTMLTSFLTVTSGSALTTVAYTSHPYNTGDFISFPIPIQVGSRQSFFPGYAFEVTKINANSFTFVADRNATGNATGGTSAAFSQTTGSTQIEVNFASHGKSVGDVWTIYRELTFTLDAQTLPAGQYAIIVVGGTDSFTIDTSLVATNDGAALEIGAIADWSKGIIQRNTLPFTAADHWFIDNLGDTLLCCYTDGPLYQWSPPLVATPALQEVTTGPTVNGGIVTLMPQAQLVSFRAEVAGLQDPLLLRWCTNGDYTIWVAAATNQAGSYRLSRGSEIRAVIQTPLITIIITDLDAWSMIYIGPPLIYSFSTIGIGAGIISPKAIATVQGQTAWMGASGFFRVVPGGGVQPMPCDVWDVVFGDLDTDNQHKCWAWSDPDYNEIYFFFPSLSGGTGEIDMYVKATFSQGQPLWDYGEMIRTAGIPDNVFGNPVACDGNRRIQQHNTGYDDDGEPMTGPGIETGYSDIGDGTDISAIDAIYPDLKWFGSDGGVNVTILTKNYASDPPVTWGPFSATRNTPIVPVRARGRMVALKIESAEKEGFGWRLMSFGYRWRRAGRRP